MTGREKQPSFRFEADHTARLLALMTAVDKAARELTRASQALKEELKEAAHD